MAATATRYSAKEAEGGKQVFNAMPPGGVDIIHSYKAEKQPDGNFKIAGLDIFKACSRKNNRTGKLDTFDQQWMEDAVNTFQQRITDNYLPPVHVGHHSDKGPDRELAGHIGKMWVGHDNKGIATLFADIVDMPSHVFSQIAKKRLPYRSIEANNPANKDVSSLALLASEVPYHKMPLTRVALSEGSSFWEGNLTRTCFSEYATPDPETGGRVAITQRFDAAYKPFKEPTKFRQLFRGLLKQQEQEFQNGGREEAPDEGDDLSPEDIEELLQLMEQEQGGEEELPEEGGEGFDPGQEQEQLPPEGEGFEPGLEEEGADEFSPEEQDEFAALGEDAGDMGQVLDALGQLSQTLQQQTAAIEGLSTGVAQNAQQTSPPPLVSSEPTENKQTFAEGSTVSNIPAWAEAMKAENAQLRETVGKLTEHVNYLFAEREEDNLVATLSEDVEAHTRQLFKEGYDENIVAKAQASVAKRLEDKLSLWRSGSIEAQDIDVAAHFGEYREGLSPAPISTAPPMAQSGSAAPTTMAERVPTAEAVQFLETTDDEYLKAKFAGDKTGSAQAVATFRNEWADMPDARKAMFDDETQYVRSSIMTLSAS